MAILNNIQEGLEYQMLRDNLFNEILEQIKEIIDEIQSNNLIEIQSKIKKLRDMCSRLSINDVIVSEIVLERIIEQTKCSDKDEAKMFIIHSINYFFSQSIDPLYRLALIQHTEEYYK